jgi:hypothetical protein
MTVRVVVIGLLAAGLAGCVVVRPPYPAERPRWQLVDSVKQSEVACVIAQPIMRRSGKEGVGVQLMLKSRGDCSVRFTSARLAFASGNTIAVDVPPAQNLPGHSLLYAWWPIRFDNNAAWNRGENLAELHLAYDIAGKQGEWTFPMVQR